jgi:hypothetical protein
MDGELNSDQKRLRTLGNIAASDLNDNLSAGIESSSKPRLPNHLVSELPVVSPPGYSGYTPGVYAGNIFGRTYAIANMHGILHAHHQREQQGFEEPRRVRAVTPLSAKNEGSWRTMEEPFAAHRPHSVRSELPRRPHSVSGGHYYPEGAKVPGYAGFVPGVASGNLIAVATPRAAKQGVHPDSSKVMRQSNRIDPSRMPSAGMPKEASNYSGALLQDISHTHDDISDAGWHAL